MNLTRLASRLRFLARELIEEAGYWQGSRRQYLARAAQQCAAQAIHLSQTPEGSRSHHAAVALHDEAINVLVDTIAHRTPEGITGRHPA